MSSRAVAREPEYVPLTQAADYAGVPVRTLRSWISRGELPAYRIGPRLIQIDLRDIDALRRRIPTVSSIAPSGRAVRYAR